MTTYVIFPGRPVVHRTRGGTADDTLCGLGTRLNDTFYTKRPKRIVECRNCLRNRGGGSGMTTIQTSEVCEVCEVCGDDYEEPWTGDTTRLLCPEHEGVQE